MTCESNQFVVSAATIVNVDEKFCANALPAKSSAPTTEIVYVFEFDSGVVGVIVTEFVLLLKTTVAVTIELPSSSFTVLLLMVEASIASLKEMAMLAEVATFIAPAAGLVLVTVGAVVSAATTVVNVDEKFWAKALPAASFTPLAPPRIETV